MSLPQVRTVLAAILLPLAVSASANQDPNAEREQLRQFLNQTINRASSFDDRFHAEVWLVDMSTRLQRYIPDHDTRLALLESIHFYANPSDLPPELVLAVIQVESAFDRFAVSRVGAQGLMQVMPFWKDEIGRPEDNLTDIHTNLSYGCRILEFYLRKEEGRLATALARYNGSTGSRVYTDKVEAAWRSNWRTEPLNWQ